MTTQIAARAYTLAEIDEMREHVKYAMHAPFGSQPTDTIIEDRLRTYMMAGVGVEELAAKAAENMAAIAVQREEALKRRAERHGPSRVTFKAGPDQPSVMEVISDEELETRRIAFNAALERVQKRD